MLFIVCTIGHSSGTRNVLYTLHRLKGLRTPPQVVSLVINSGLPRVDNSLPTPGAQPEPTHFSFLLNFLSFALLISFHLWTLIIIPSHYRLVPVSTVLTVLSHFGIASSLLHTFSRMWLAFFYFTLLVFLSQGPVQRTNKWSKRASWQISCLIEMIKAVQRSRTFGIAT